MKNAAGANVNPFGGEMPAGVWHRVAVTFDASTSSIGLRVNGDTVWSTCALTSHETAGDIYVGAYGDDDDRVANSLNGQITCLRFWDTHKNIEDMDISHPACPTV